MNQLIGPDLDIICTNVVYNENNDLIKNISKKFTTDFPPNDILANDLFDDSLNYSLNNSFNESFDDEIWTPQYNSLSTKLNELIPGTYLDHPHHKMDYHIIIELINGGILRIVDDDCFIKKIEGDPYIKTRELLENGKINECHIGLSLSSDRRWKYNSWGILGNNSIMEITEPKLAYLTNRIYKYDKYKIGCNIL